jgi:hypothetical protein
MLDNEKIDIVVAFEGGSGTKDMIIRAKNAGIEVLEISFKVIYKSSFDKETSVLMNKNN